MEAFDNGSYNIQEIGGEIFHTNPINGKRLKKFFVENDIFIPEDEGDVESRVTVECGWFGGKGVFL